MWHRISFLSLFGQQAINLIFLLVCSTNFARLFDCLPVVWLFTCFTRFSSVVYRGSYSWRASKAIDENRFNAFDHLFWEKGSWWKPIGTKVYSGEKQQRDLQKGEKVVPATELLIQFIGSQSFLLLPSLKFFHYCPSARKALVHRHISFKLNAKSIISSIWQTRMYTLISCLLHCQENDALGCLFIFKMQLLPL